MISQDFVESKTTIGNSEEDLLNIELDTPTIFICLSNYSMQIINYIVSLVIYFFIGLFGLSTLVVFLFCLLLVILFVSLVFLSRSGE